jgi:hypothetical protein
MKKKSSKITHGGKHVPKLDKQQVEALVQELARPERLAREAERLLRRLRDDRALMGIRFAPEALVKAAQEAEGADAQAVAAAIADRLVTPEFRDAAQRTLEARARAGGKLDEILPYRVGVHLLDAESEKKRPPGQNPFWLGVLSASAHELPLALYLESRPLEELEAEAARGAVAAGFRAFLEGDARVQAVRRAAPKLDLESTLLHAMLGFLEAHEIALPLHAALRGPIEAARAARRRQTLAGVGSAGPREEEQAKTLMAAVEKDKDRAVPAYREELLERFREAAAQSRAAETAVPARRRLAALLAALVALEALPVTRHVPLMAAYEAAAPRAIDESGEGDERRLLHMVLGRPLDAAGYKTYAAWLRDNGRAAEAKAFAAAAATAFPEDPELPALAG